MKIYIINEVVIKNTLNQLCISDDILKAINDIVTKFDHSFTSNIYKIFTIYSNAYVNAYSDKSGLSASEALNITNKFKAFNINVDTSNVYVVDVFDLLIHRPLIDNSLFKLNFYEDLYLKLDTLHGTEIADKLISTISEAMELLFIHVEDGILSTLINKTNTGSYIPVYFEYTPYVLTIYILN